MSIKLYLDKNRVFKQKEGGVLHIPEEIKTLIKDIEQNDYDIEKDISDDIDMASTEDAQSIDYNFLANRFMVFKGMFKAISIKNIESVPPKEEFKEKPFFGIEALRFEIKDKKVVNIVAEFKGRNITKEKENEHIIWLYKELLNNQDDILHKIYSKHNLFNLNIKNENVYTSDFKKVLEFIETGSAETNVFDCLDFNFGNLISMTAYETSNKKNILKINYNIKLPEYKELKIQGIEIKNEINGFYIHKVEGIVKKVLFSAFKNEKNNIEINSSVKNIAFTHDKINSLLNHKSFSSNNVTELRIVYKENVWPLEIDNVDLRGELSFLEFSYSPIDKHLEQKIEELSGCFTNLSANNNLFVAYLSKVCKNKLFEAISMVLNKKAGELSQITNEEIEVLEMNYDWMMKRRQVFEYLMPFYEELINSMECDNTEIGSRRYVKDLRNKIQKLGFKVFVY